MATQTNQQYLYSPVVQVAVNGSYAVGATQSWDAFIRQSYEQANQAISRQASALLQRGNVTAQEARMLVEGQRNALVIQMRQRLSPWGRIYSELLKSSSNLPTLEQLVARKGSIEAVLTSVGKSRSSVNRFAATVRVAGPAAIIIQITLSGVIIAQAAPQDRPRVAAGQAGSIAGGAAGGAGGAWAGCLAGAALLSPSLVLPIVGEIGTGGGCLIGGIVGAFGFGAAGAAVGERAGTATYDFVTRFEWTRG
jgi:predicted aconitase with swiveling domain